VGALILCGDLKAVGGYDALVEDLYYYIYIYFYFVLHTPMIRGIPRNPMKCRCDIREGTLSLADPVN
jgi:hypothetical protein